jgi:RNA-binding protein YhbY
MKLLSSSGSRYELMLERGSVVDYKITKDFTIKNPLVVEADNNLTEEVASEISKKLSKKSKDTVKVEVTNGEEK